jgi:murein DD-endopeptidase MepM/ murein hydrolase activator NlpD
MMLVASMLACTNSNYWVAPKATDTPPPDIAFLLQPAPTDTPALSIAVPSIDLRTPAETAIPQLETPVLQPSLTPPPVNTTPILYYTQAADTLPVVAVRFGVLPEEITSPDPFSETAQLPPNQLLIIPRRLVNTTSSQHIFPDSEVVYSPSASDFDIQAFVDEAGGYLSTYKEWFKTTQTDNGAEIVARVAIENSINPRLLLALLEYQSGWVYGEPVDKKMLDYPMGLVDLNKKGLYHQLIWTMNRLSIGYYSWREGRLIELRFKDGVTARLAPDLNAGSAALQYYFSQIYTGEEWVRALDMQQGLPALYERMFGSPWLRAQAVEPLYPPGLEQPPLILPFELQRVWSFTGGPHGAWEHDGSYAALDFAPASSAPGCLKSNAWVTAASAGLVVRSGNGVVVLDLDGDGFEQTGWVVLYLHVSIEGRAPVGTWVGAGDRLGHPSCEGGQSTGTHLHIARKYNGEWIAAAGPMPFVLSGWMAQAGEQAYKGNLTRDGQNITACTCASLGTNIIRSVDDPYEAGS